VNVAGQFNILRAFLPAIVKEKQGHIITMSSVVGYMASSLASDYCASKAATISLHESLRYELDKHYKAPHVRTTLVCPGMVQTQMFSQAKNYTAASPLPKKLIGFFNPLLAPHVVVKAIIAAMDVQESRDIFLPAYTQLAPLGRVVPYFVRDAVHWVSNTIAIFSCVC
jgi:short-subunit dehydrogenase